MIDYLPWVLMVWTVVNMWLAGNKNVLAWYSGIVSQGGWLLFDFYVQAWGLMPLAVILTAVYVRNIRRWHRGG